LFFITLTSGFVAYRSGYFESSTALDTPIYSQHNIHYIDSPIVKTQDSATIPTMSDADRTMMYSSKSALIFDDNHKRVIPHLFFDSTTKKEVEKKTGPPASKSSSVGINPKSK